MDRIPYTYLLIHKPTKSYYYGVRYAKGCHPNDLWVSYFTSSRHVRGLINKYGEDSFECQVRRVFDNVDSARRWESKVLKRMKVVIREDFINKTDNVSIDPAMASKGMRGKTGNRCPAYGRKNPILSALNSLKVGDKNPMYGRRGELAPAYGRTGENHPMFGKKNPNLSLKCKEVVTCPHCGKIGQRSGMYRWHFNNCKLKGD